MPKTRLFNLKNLGTWAASGIKKKKKKKNNGEAEAVQIDSDSGSEKENVCVHYTDLKTPS